MVSFKISNLPLAGVKTTPLTKTLLGYKSACPARKRCVQYVSLGRDQSVMMFWGENNDDGMVMGVITDRSRPITSLETWCVENACLLDLQGWWDVD